MPNINTIQKTIGYKFKDECLLLTAFTHQSYANENNSVGYDRLEFLGDAIIEMVVSDYIYNHLNSSSGEMTKLRSGLVSTENLYKISIDLGLDKLMLKSKALLTASKKNIADLFESLVGAVYIDGGLEFASKIVLKFIVKDENNINYVMQNCVDHKTKFQEYMQSKAIPFEYRVLSSRGLDHEKIFEVGLYVNGVLTSLAEGNSIHSAESKCAELYFIKNDV